MNFIVSTNWSVVSRCECNIRVTVCCYWSISAFGLLIAWFGFDSDPSARPDAATDSIRIFGMQLAEHLAAGLADNWSQVRLAASQATRQFLSALEPEDRVDFYSLLLPRMCLNRLDWQILLLESILPMNWFYSKQTYHTVWSLLSLYPTSRNIS